MLLKASRSVSSVLFLHFDGQKYHYTENSFQNLLLYVQLFFIIPIINLILTKLDGKNCHKGNNDLENASFCG